MQKGDICELENRTGLWVFFGDCPAAIPPGAMGKFVRATNIDPGNPHEACTLSIANATVVASPSFTPGDSVNHEHQDGTGEN
jgi:hypothetical protein